MGLTVNNTNTAVLLNILNQTAARQTTSLLRLSTGQKINSGRDDPAGLIAIRSLSAELVSVEAAITNGMRANSMLSVADSSLTEVENLLSEIESLAAQSTSSGGLSSAEIAANQSQIDSAINSINRIIQNTTFNGKKLLDGQQSIRATATDNDITDLKIYSRPSSTASQTFAVEVTSKGAVASAVLATVTDAASDVSAATFTIAGSLGTATITVAGADVSGSDTLSDVRDKIIAAASDTGVSAAITGLVLHIMSREYGEDAFVSASYINGDADFLDVAYTEGTDAGVTVNGQQANVDGLRVSFNSNGSSGEFVLATSGNVVGSQGDINITGGGMTFQLGASSSTQSTVGIAGLFSHQLGNSTVGYLNELKSGGSNDVSTDANAAVLIAKAALNQVATQRGRIGGFQKFQVDTSINSLNATKQALEGARGIINDVDYALETAELSKQQVLMQSAISLLGVASQQSAQILSLLR